MLSAFHWMGELISLNLANNQIQGVESKAFANNSLLEYLSLSHNAISVIKTGAFHGLSKLLQLHLSENNLDILTVGMLFALENAALMIMGAEYRSVTTPYQTQSLSQSPLSTFFALFYFYKEIHTNVATYKTTFLQTC